MQLRASLFWGIAALSLSATTAFAQTAQTANVVVSANVVKECRFNTLATPPALGFTNVGSTATVNPTVSTTLQYFCSRNMPFTLFIGTTNLAGPTTSMSRTMSWSSSNPTPTPSPLPTLPYSLGWTLPTGGLVGTGFATTTALTLSLNATIAIGDLKVAIPGAYAETVTVTLTPV